MATDVAEKDRVFTIRHRITGAVLWTGSESTFREAIQKAIAEGADLTGADLTRADLTGADLTRADLTGADLTRADLTRAYLTRANLTRANLTRADLTGADLTRAYLTRANLTRANLTGAHLTPIRDDLWAVLSGSPKEVAGLRRALIEGRVDGSTYSGKCACLVGTIANVRGCRPDELGLVKPDAGRPIERFFLAISPGDTPDKSQFAMLAVEWIDQWLMNMREAFSS